jgi:hypothetical protein
MRANQEIPQTAGVGLRGADALGACGKRGKSAILRFRSLLSSTQMEMKDFRSGDEGFLR